MTMNSYNDEDLNKTSQESFHDMEADTKQQQILCFRNLNKEFLTKRQQSLQDQQSQGKPYTRDEETQHLHEKIDALQELVQHLSHELRVTQDAHQLDKDQSLSKVELLCSELDRQNSRHAQIVKSFRKRLIESETARMKMQDQLSSYMEKDIQREKVFKDAWKQATTRVIDNTKWVDEQMDIWKESMEEHQKRLVEATLRGKIDAASGGKEKLAPLESNTRGKEQTAARGNRNESSNCNARNAKSENEKLSQRRRRLWGESGNELGGNDCDDFDEEEMIMYGQVLH
jgi:hypothetical protein